MKLKLKILMVQFNGINLVQGLLQIEFKLFLKTMLADGQLTLTKPANSTGGDLYEYRFRGKEGEVTSKIYLPQQISRKQVKTPSTNISMQVYPQDVKINSIVGTEDYLVYAFLEKAAKSAGDDKYSGKVKNIQFSIYLHQDITRDDQNNNPRDAVSLLFHPIKPVPSVRVKEESTSESKILSESQNDTIRKVGFNTASSSSHTVVVDFSVVEDSSNSNVDEKIAANSETAAASIDDTKPVEIGEDETEDEEEQIDDGHAHKKSRRAVIGDTD